VGILLWFNYFCILFTGSFTNLNVFSVLVLLWVIVVVKGQQRVAPGVPPQQYVGQVSC
jgi:steroid 5-alpha reductase family enzyme